ncbi:cytochrome c and c1 heme-lyase [Neoconidiobolus thromboides FSU 785]|nr:cytochrome c and c1 heme-lyase [Neoconidiobolus thromboides FSU 785]
MYYSSTLNHSSTSAISNLKQEREISSIPKTDTEEGESNWVYPSEQMFYNAMKRKSWKANEEDMKVIVPIHNLINERAWNLVMEYERKYKSVCDTPKLDRFEGNPNKISPKARVMSWLGYSLPFDRHDWYVNRCGKEVHYVIDFYSGKKQENSSNNNNKDSRSELPSFYIDARPALDSFNNLKDRVLNWLF